VARAASGGTCHASASDESIAPDRHVLHAAPREMSVSGTDARGRFFEALTGGCMCGRVRFVITAPLVGALFCHCKRCQRRSGSAFAVTAAMVPGSFRIVDGAESLAAWQPVDGWEKSYCRECGSHLYTTNPEQREQVSVRVGALDGDPGIRPSVHQFTAYAASWFPIADDRLPRFPERMPAGLRPPGNDA
jgi:hypothetical protein